MSVLRRVRVYEDDVTISLLPLHHTYQAMAGFLAFFYSGACIAFNESLRHLQDDMLLFRPTIFIAVPLLLESFLNGVKKKYSKVFGGKALAILKSTGKPGEMTLTASCDGFNDATLTVKTTETKPERPDAIAPVAAQEQDFQVYAANRRIHVTGTDDYHIYNANGMETDRHATLATGVYLVRSGATVRKVIVK